MDAECLERLRIEKTLKRKRDMDAECLQCLWIEKTLKQLKREKEASQRQMSGSTKSKLCRRHFWFLPKVKRFPFLSDLQYAEFALTLYEKQPHAKDTKFEVVEVLGVRRALVRFPVMADLPSFDLELEIVVMSAYLRSLDTLDDASKYFCFFELLDCGSGEFQLVTLKKSEPEEVSQLTRGCGFCPVEKEYPHPETIVGGLESVPLDLVSQKEMARCFKGQLVKNHQPIKPKRLKKPIKK